MHVRFVSAGLLFTMALAAGYARAQYHGDYDHGRHVAGDSIELGLHERHEGTAIRAHDHKVGWVRADFVDAEGRRGGVVITVKNETSCRLEMTFFVRSKEGHHDRDRESTTVRVRRNDRESRQVRFELARDTRPRVVIDSEGRLEDCR